MESNVWVACVAMLAVGFGGCGGDGIDVDTNASNVCSEIAEVACHNLYQCCTEGEIETFLRVDEPRSEEQCRDDLRRACSRAMVTLQDSVEANRVRFDAAIMNTCLQSLVAPEGTCAEVVDALPWTDACMNTAWIGTLAAGEACRFAHDCAGGADATCGPAQQCIAKPTQGQPCGTGCASAFYCAGTCQPRLAVGTPCTSGDQCQEDLFCDFSSPTPTCTARGAGGGACNGPSGCLSGQCIPGTCSGQGGSCYRDTDCPRQCSNGPAFCTQDYQCGLGTCQVSAASCSLPGDCGVGDTCIFPAQCLPATCMGERVCTAPQYTVDYCEDAVRQLPVL